MLCIKLSYWFELRALTEHLQLSASGPSLPSGTSWRTTSRTRSWWPAWSVRAVQTTPHSESWAFRWRSEMEACYFSPSEKTLENLQQRARREEVLQTPAGRLKVKVFFFHVKCLFWVESTCAWTYLHVNRNSRVWVTVLHQSGMREKCFVIRFFSYCLWLIACIPDHIRFKVISVYKGTAGVLLVN